ncbi:MAG: ABC transporter ATP-binding protein [Lutibacter sp.]
MLLNIEKLSVSFDGKKVVNNISFSFNENEIIGIVGESGSGKTVSSLAILKLLSKKAKIEGKILFKNENLLKLSDLELQKIRGNEIAMIFQEPMSSLNPSLTCGFQVAEILKTHEKLSNEKAKKEVIALFNKVKLPRANEIFKQYPHQISGGQQQRVMIAMAIACKPSILIADEPTTALDVTVQKNIIALLKELQQETKMSVLFISHDLNLVAEIADQIMVMYKGEIVEIGSTKQIFNQPKNNYTKALLNAKPSLTKRLIKLPTVHDFIEGNTNFNEQLIADREIFHQKLYNQKPLLEVKNLATYFKSFRKSLFYNKQRIIKAVDEVSFKLYEGETLGLVGESGCGKTTLGRTLMGIEKMTSGEIYYKGERISSLSKSEKKQFKKDVQLIFQDPYSSLNPRIMVGKAIMEPMEVHQLYKKSVCKEKTFQLLEKVGLTADSFYKYPHEFSGGQRQRIVIARAIALMPKLIICDESVSALDVSVQAQVLNLLNELKNEFKFTYIFISHDLAVVKYMSDNLLVMNKGKIEEKGDADEIYSNPKSKYTQKLIESIPKGI